MRTTVTLDQDVQLLIRDAMQRSRKSFKATLNDGLRAGLRMQSSAKAGAPFVLKARSMGLRQGLDPAGFNKLVDDLDAEAFPREVPRGRTT